MFKFFKIADRSNAAKSSKQHTSNFNSSKRRERQLSAKFEQNRLEIVQITVFEPRRGLDDDQQQHHIVRTTPIQ